MGAVKTVRERRDTSPAGQWNRAQFEASVRTLRELGLSARTIEHLRRQARIRGQLPHELLVELVEGAMLQFSVIDVVSRVSGGI